MSPTSLPGFVHEVELRLGGLLAHDEGAGIERNVLAAASAHLCLGNGGKRIRPRLVLLLGSAGHVEEGPLRDVATAAELIHGASLLHDDVVDEASLRRGRATVNASYGNQVAVLAGDWLLSSGFSLLRPYAREMTSAAIEVVAEMSRAALAELGARGKAELPLERWRAIAEGKTGALFGWCGQSAARLAGDERLAERFDAFGRRLGIAFQLADDLKDVWGAGEGKDRFADLRNRNPSVPILLAAQRSEGFLRELREAWKGAPLAAADAEKLGARLFETQAVDDCVEALENEIKAALDLLEDYSSLPWHGELLELIRSFECKASRA